MTEQKGIGMTILGVVAIIAIVGLVLLFTKVGATGQVAGSSLPGGVIKGFDCAVFRDCNGPYPAYFAGTTLKAGKPFKICKCPNEAGETLVA